MLCSNFASTPSRPDVSHCGSTAFIINIYTACSWDPLYLSNRNSAEDGPCPKDAMKWTEDITSTELSGGAGFWEVDPVVMEPHQAYRQASQFLGF